MNGFRLKQTNNLQYLSLLIQCEFTFANSFHFVPTHMNVAHIE